MTIRSRKSNGKDFYYLADDFAVLREWSERRTDRQKQGRSGELVKVIHAISPVLPPLPDRVGQVEYGVCLSALEPAEAVATR